jgi:hypothetical protein
MSISFKVVFGNEVRRFTLPLANESNLLEQVMSLLGKLYNLTADQVKNLELKYVDNEGDLITIGAPYDLKEAFNHMSNGLIRLNAKVSNRQRIILNETISTLMNDMKLNSVPVKLEAPVKEIRPLSFLAPLPVVTPIVFNKEEPVATPTIYAPPVQKLDFSKLPSNTDNTSAPNSGKSDTPHGVNSFRGSQTVTSSRGGSVITRGGSTVSTTHSSNVSVSYAGGSIVTNTHGSAVITKQGSGIVTGKGNSLIIQKK